MHQRLARSLADDVTTPVQDHLPDKQAVDLWKLNSDESRVEDDGRGTGGADGYSDIICEDG